MSVEGQDEREWIVPWGPGRQRIAVVPKSTLAAALVGSEARERGLRARIEEKVEAVVRAAEAVLDSWEIPDYCQPEHVLEARKGADALRAAIAALAGVVEAEPDEEAKC